MTVSPTVEERLLELLNKTGLHPGGPFPVEEQARAILAAAKEHGLVVTASEETGELDAAWKEAEAALPEGYVLTMVGRVRVPNRRDPFWQSYAEAWLPPGHTSRISGDGPTPAAALQTLAAKLRDFRR